MKDLMLHRSALHSPLTGLSLRRPNSISSRRCQFTRVSAFWRRKKGSKLNDHLDKNDQKENAGTSRLDSVTLGNPGDSREDASEERQSNLGATFQGNHGKDEAQADQPVVINTGDEELIVQNPTQQAPTVIEITLDEGQNLEDMSKASGLPLDTLIAANGGSRDVTLGTKLRFQLPGSEDAQEMSQILSLQAKVGESNGVDIRKHAGSQLQWALSPERPSLRTFGPFFLAAGVFALIFGLLRFGKKLEDESPEDLAERTRRRRAAMQNPNIKANNLQQNSSDQNEIQNLMQERRDANQQASSSNSENPPNLGERKGQDWPTWIKGPSVWVCMLEGSQALAFKLNPEIPTEESWLVFEGKEDAESFRGWALLHRYPFSGPENLGVHVLKMKPSKLVDLASEGKCGLAYLQNDTIKIDATRQEMDVWAEIMSFAQNVPFNSSQQDSVSVQNIQKRLKKDAQALAESESKRKVQEKRANFMNGKMTKDNIPNSVQPTVFRNGAAINGKGDFVEAEFTDSNRHQINGFSPSHDEHHQDESQEDIFRARYRELQKRARDLTQYDSQEEQMQTIVAEMPQGEDEVEKMLREMRTEPNWNQLGSLGSNLQAKLESGGSGPFQSGQDALDHLKNTRRDSKTSPNTTSNERSPFKESNGGGDGGDRFRKAFSPRNSSGSDSGSNGSNRSSQPLPERPSSGNRGKSKAERAQDAMDRVLKDYRASSNSQTQDSAKTTNRSSQMPKDFGPRGPLKQNSTKQTPPSSNPSKFTSSFQRNGSENRKSQERVYEDVREKEGQSPARNPDNTENRPSIRGWKRSSTKSCQSDQASPDAVSKNKKDKIPDNENFTKASETQQSQRQTDEVFRKEEKFNPKGGEPTSQSSKTGWQSKFKDGTSSSFRPASEKNSDSAKGGFSQFSQKFSQKAKSSFSPRENAYSQKQAVQELKFQASQRREQNRTPAQKADLERIFKEARANAQNSVLDIEREKEAQRKELEKLEEIGKDPAVSAFENDGFTVIEPPTKLRSDLWRSLKLIHFPTFRDNTGEYYMAMDISDVETFSDPHMLGFVDFSDAQEYASYRRLLGDNSCYTVTTATPNEILETGAGADSLGLTVFMPRNLPVTDWIDRKMPLEEADQLLLKYARRCYEKSASS